MIDFHALHDKHCKQEPFVSGKVVAKHLSMNYYTVMKMAKRGQLPSYKSGKCRRFRISEVEAAISGT